MTMPSPRSWDLATIDLRKNAGESMEVCGSWRTAPPGETDRAAGLWFGESMHGDVLTASDFERYGDFWKQGDPVAVGYKQNDCR
jgi:hypothetical protein